MKKLAVAAALLFAVACASSNDDAPYVSPPAPVSDPRVGELQTAMTELLERIDVLNDRIARLEEENASLRSGAAGSQPAVSQPAVSQQPAVEASRRAESAPLHQQPQRALVGAKLAEDYRKAIMLFGRGSLGEARQQFELVLESDPSGDLADNALFWIGETYFAARDYVNAMRFYARVTAEYPDQNKAPDAMLKTALAQERTGDLALARKTLQQVIERYPYSTSASSAKQELQRIRY